MNKNVAQLLDKLSLFYLKLEQRNELPTYNMKKILPYFHKRVLNYPQFFYKENGKVPSISTNLISSRKKYKIYNLRFPTPCPSPYPENNLVHCRYYQIKNKKGLPTIIILHGWRIKDYTFFHRSAKRFVKMGLNSIIIELPYHLRRKLPGTYDGEYSVSVDIIRTIETMRQSVLEIRSIINWLKKEGINKIGIFGVSLGAWIGAMLGVVEKRIDFLMLISPPANPEIMFKESPLAGLIKIGIPKIEHLFKRYKSLLKIINPIFYKPVIDKNKILIIQGKYDYMVPQKVVEELWQAWEEPKLQVFPHSHLSLLFFEPRLFPCIKEFINQILYN